jgi:hypothetical protein
VKVQKVDHVAVQKTVGEIAQDSGQQQEQRDEVQSAREDRFFQRPPQSANRCNGKADEEFVAVL